MQRLFLYLFIATIILACEKDIEQSPEQKKSYSLNTIDSLINTGKYQKSRSYIHHLRCRDSTLSDTTKIALRYREARMKRIALDFPKTHEDVVAKLAKYFSDLNKNQLKNWERQKKLEMKVIDGSKRYFHNAVNNLFLLDDSARAVKEKKTGETENKREQFCKKHTRNIIENITSQKSNIGNPVDIKITFSIEVNPDAVPEGEIIRCWMPYPRTSRKRQKNIELLSVNDSNYVIAPEHKKHRTIYMEKRAKKNAPTVFSYSLRYTSRAEWHSLDDTTFPPYTKTGELYQKYTDERSPHIIFSRRIKTLTDSIIKGVENPYQKVRKIYEWIDYNIPWASAREYSTIPNIPRYVLDNMHGDCGMQTLLFITMARYAGIPAKWQSGWMMHPGHVNLHDWAEVYYPNTGWVPVDQSFSLQDTESTKVKYFYTSGIDAYRFIVNDSWGKTFYPHKIYPRSETVDFQRGEVEWRGGNLYFNQWDYDMEVEY